MSFVFVSGEFVNELRERLASASGPWSRISADLCMQAEQAMSRGPWSVTFHPSRAASKNIHDYYYEAPYWWPDPNNPSGRYIQRDGVPRPDRHKEHWQAFRELSETVALLCSAGHYLQEPRYLKRAVKLLKVWFLDAKTRMNPHMEYAEAIPNYRTGSRTGIVALSQLDRVVHALGFLQLYPAWDKELEAMSKWIAAMLSWMMNSSHGAKERDSGNNHATWWAVHAAAYASFLNKADTLKDVCRHYKHHIVAKQIEPNGAMPHEISRTKSFSYSLFNLEAQALMCEIAWQRGISLWTYKTKDGRGIAGALTYMLPFIGTPSRWPYRQIDSFQPQEQLALQLGAVRLQHAEMARVNRTRRDERIPLSHSSPLGPIALLPGYTPV